jgi:PAS domain S-box-containing protein
MIKKKETVSRNGFERDIEITNLEQEKKILSDQVKRLIKAETRLYEYQLELDAQLKEYQKLYELNRKFVGNFNIQNIFEYAIEYIIHYLEYERIVFLTQPEGTALFVVCAADGYYDETEKKTVTGLTIREDNDFLLPLFTGTENIICMADSEEEVLVKYRSKLLMNEYIVYPLGARGRPSAILIAGNSAENAVLYRRVDIRKRTLLGMGNLVGLLSSTVENYISYTNMMKAVDQERLVEARYRSIFENAAEGIFQITPEGRFISCNPAGAAILGYDTPEELIESITDIEHQLWVNPQTQMDLRDLIVSGREIKNFEVEFYRKDKTRQWALMSIKPFFNEEHILTHMDGITQDISERKRAEAALKDAQEELIRKEKLSILGQLAGIVGHEIRNPLGVINNAVYFLKTIITDANDTVKEYLDIIKQEIDNSEHIITDLLDFARTKPPNAQSVAISATINQCLKKYFLPGNITIDINFPETLSLLWADPSQLEQIFQNLITNAVQAMPDGGILRISARQIPCPEPQFNGKDNTESRTINISPGTDYIEISVEDTGKGILPENMKKLFQPLFTTKAKGIGLGLVACKNLVEANGGRIGVTSTTEGTVFTVSFPVGHSDV